MMLGWPISSLGGADFVSVGPARWGRGVPWISQARGCDSEFQRTNRECLRKQRMRSRSRGVEELKSRTTESHSPLQTPATPRVTRVGLSTPQLLDSSTSELNERTGNVYENKGQGQEVEELSSRLKNRGSTARLAGGWAGAAQPPDFSNFGNKARMSLKTNDPAVICIEKRTQNEHSFERENCKLMHKNSEFCEVRR